ncbi:MAG: hypothetical protein ACXABY_17470 [Candidatus Thorarchaeota archaeon]
MEPVDIFTIIILVAMFSEAYVRDRRNRKADALLKESESLGRTPEVPKEIDVELMSVPRPPNEWSPGLEAYLNARPMLIFFVIIIGLTIVLGSIGLVATVPKMMIAVLAIVLVTAFHSGPDRYTMYEYFLQISVSAELGSLNNRELGLLSHAKAHFEGWVNLQIVFALGLLVGVLLPTDFAALYVLALSLIIFLVLGYAYEIQKGIFAGPV